MIHYDFAIKIVEYIFYDRTHFIPFKTIKATPYYRHGNMMIVLFDTNLFQLFKRVGKSFISWFFIVLILGYKIGNCPFLGIVLITI